MSVRLRTGPPGDMTQCVDLMPKLLSKGVCAHSKCSVRLILQCKKFNLPSDSDLNCHSVHDLSTERNRSSLGSFDLSTRSLKICIDYILRTTCPLHVQV